MKINKGEIFGVGTLEFLQRKSEKTRNFKFPLVLAIMGVCSLSFRFDLNSKLGINALVLNLFFYLVLTTGLLIYFNKVLTSRYAVLLYSIFVIIFTLPWKVLDFLSLNYYLKFPRQHVIPEDVKKKLIDNISEGIKTSSFDHKSVLYLLMGIAILLFFVHQRKDYVAYVIVALAMSWNFFC
jgi:hypothetical protein